MRGRGREGGRGRLSNGGEAAGEELQRTRPPPPPGRWPPQEGEAKPEAVRRLWGEGLTSFLLIISNLPSTLRSYYGLGWAGPIWAGPMKRLIHGNCSLS